MGTVNDANPRVDLSVRVFDNFYQFDITVPANEYDAVNSFFRSVFSSREAADSFTIQVFRIAQETNTSVLKVLDAMKGRDEIRLTADLTYFLNGIRSPSTLLGINAVTTPNAWAARNVRP